MYKATEAIVENFNHHELKFEAKELGGKSFVNAGFKSETGVPVDVLFISGDDDSDVAVRIFNLCKVPEGRQDKLLRLINDANRRLRYFKFVMDDENDINAEYDFPINTEDVGETAYELFVRAMHIIDDALPALLKGIWE